MDLEAGQAAEREGKGRSIARGAMWNLGGQIAPLVVAVTTIPFLIRSLGDDRFGVLSLAWVVIGYFGLVDLGLGRAMTQALAQRIGAGREDEVPVIFWSTFALMAALGVIGALGGAVLASWLVNHALAIPDGLRDESRVAFLLLAVALPIDLTLSALRGAMEAKQRFDLTSMSRIATGTHTYLSPILVLLITDNLVTVVAVLILGRFVAWLVAFGLCLRVYPALRRGPTFRRSVLGPLLRLGGWMNVCGLVFPLMVTLDRFMIGSLVSVTAVTYYATPYEMVTKLWVFPVAVSGVLFPAFAARFVHDPGGTARLFNSGLRTIFCAIVPAGLLVVTFAPDILRLWLGSEFGGTSARVLQILAIGVCVNSLSNVPFALIEGAGRADLAAKLQLGELPFYVLAVWLSANWFGIVGVASVWTIRGAIDTAAMYTFARRLLGWPELPVGVPVLVVTGGALALAFAVSPFGLPGKTAFFVASLAGFLAVGWSRVLGDEERALAIVHFDGFRTRLALNRMAARPQDVA